MARTRTLSMMTWSGVIAAFTAFTPVSLGAGEGGSTDRANATQGGATSGVKEAPPPGSGNTAKPASGQAAPVPARTVDSDGRSTPDSSPPAGTQPRGAVGGYQQPDAARFIIDAYQDALMETRIGTSSRVWHLSRPVRDLSTRLADLGMRSLGQLETIAARHNLPLYKELEKPRQEAIQNLAATNEKQMDRAYLDRTISHLEATLERYQLAAQQMPNPELKRWAAETVPQLQPLLNTARALRQTMNQAPASGGRSRPGA